MPMRPVRLAPALASALALGLILVACPLGGGHALAKASADSADPGAAFMRKTASEAGVTTLPSGLEYKVLHAGDSGGAHPAPGDELVLNYVGSLPDGAIFDSTEQQGGMARMPYHGLIQGWMEALKLMRPGDTWMLYVPANLGYGDKGAGPIPPNSPLVFKINLVAVHPAG